MKPCALILSILLTIASNPAWADDEIVSGPDRRHELDLRIKEIETERDQISVAAPAVYTFIGLGIAAVGALVLGGGIARNNDPDGSPSGTAAIGGGAALIAIGGVTSFISGTVWSRRSDKRNALDAERESLIKERGTLSETLSRVEIRSPHRDGTQFVTLGVRF